MSDLLHDYDAAKRRDYYLRTRKLKGHTKKAIHPPVPKTHAQRQKELEARVNKLKDRLAKLHVILKQMTEAAQKRSGVSKNSSEKASIKKHDSKSVDDPTSKYAKKTQKQKDEAAAAAKKYRDKNASLSDQVTELNKKIKAIRERINRLQKTGSVGASKSSKK